MANDAGADFETLARQYWSAWGDALRSGAGVTPKQPGWNEALDWWSQLARGATSGGGFNPSGFNPTGFNPSGFNPSAFTAPGFGGAAFGAGGFPGMGGMGLPGMNPAGDAVDRFNTQAREWYGRMQQVAAQFAGQNANPADISTAWKQALGQGAANPFATLFSSMQGPGQHGVEQWAAQVGPMLESMQKDAHAWLRLPQFGFAREHQERWQQLADAQLVMHETMQAHNALMGEASQRAFEVFERKLAERSEPGKQLESARALFDLWIDAAEEAYAEIALSPRFRDSYGAMVNAQMRLRAAVQREVEQSTGLLGMPTRTEIDAAHRKIVQLERELRRLKDALHGDARASTQAHAEAAAPTPRSRTSAPKRRPAAAAAAPAASAATPKSPAKPATGRGTAKRAAVPSASQTRKATTGKPAAGKATAGKASRAKATPGKAPATQPSAAKRAVAKKAAARRTPTSRAAATRTGSPRPTAKPAAKRAVAARTAAKPTVVRAPTRRPAARSPFASLMPQAPQPLPGKPGKPAKRSKQGGR